MRVRASAGIPYAMVPERSPQKSFADGLAVDIQEKLKQHGALRQDRKQLFVILDPVLRQTVFHCDSYDRKIKPCQKSGRTQLVSRNDIAYQRADQHRRDEADEKLQKIRHFIAGTDQKTNAPKQAQHLCRADLPDAQAGHRSKAEADNKQPVRKPELYSVRTSEGVITESESHRVCTSSIQILFRNQNRIYPDRTAHIRSRDRRSARRNRSFRRRCRDPRARTGNPLIGLKQL